MYFIDRSYFIGEINIPNADGEIVGSQLDVYIQKYEPEFLLRLMGPVMYAGMKDAGFPAQIGLPVPTVDNQKYIDLIEGKSYTYYGRGYKFFGIAPRYNTTDFFKESPIANYVYFRFMENLTTQTTSGGEVKTSNENAISAPPGGKMVKAWNEISKWERDYRFFTRAYPLSYSFDMYYYGHYFQLINEFNI